MVGTRSLGARLNPELAVEDRCAGVEAAHHAGPVAAARVQSHQDPVGLLAQRVVAEQALRVQDRQAVIVGLFRLIDNAVQDLETQFTHALPFGEDPIVVHTLEQVAAVQLDRFGMAIGVASEALELVQVEPGLRGRVPLERVALGEDPRTVVRRGRKQLLQPV